MGRWLIQCMTVVTILASLLHGQCLLSCSLQPPVHKAVSPQVKNGVHSCCPQPDDQKNQKSEKPCQPDSPVINPISNTAQPTANALMPLVLLDQPGGLLTPP